MITHHHYHCIICIPLFKSHIAVCLDFRNVRSHPTRWDICYGLVVHWDKMSDMSTRKLKLSEVYPGHHYSWVHPFITENKVNFSLPDVPCDEVTLLRKSIASIFGTDSRILDVHLIIEFGLPIVPSSTTLHPNHTALAQG